MSKNKECDNEVDIYGDLPNFSSDNTISELENAKNNLENELKALHMRLKDIEVENDKLKKENEALNINISSLYKTAACEIKRKDQMIQELRREKDSILFRRHRNGNQKYSRRHDAQPEAVHIIDDYQPSVENEACIIEENRHQDYDPYQYADDTQYYANYGEDEVITTFPEEDEDVYKMQNIPQKVPDTIFSRRKAQQLKLLMKNSDSVKDSISVGITEDPEIIIEDSNKTQCAILDRRKNQILKSCNEQHDISKAVVEVDRARSPALDHHTFIMKEKSSTITSRNKNVDLSHKKTELLTSKHLDTVRQTVETNIKTSSNINELRSASVKTPQNSRIEDVKISKTSHHKSKEHSDVDKSHRKKSFHASSKDKRSGSDSHSYRKSSSHSKSKFSTHSSSHRSPAKNSLSPRSPKGRSIRETSVSRALQSLRSKSRTQLKSLDCESSRSLKERDRHKEVENKGSKNRESQEHRKTEHTRVKSHTSSKSISQKSQTKVTPLPGIQLVTENVSTESKLAPDTVKTMTVPDSKTTSNINQDINMTTKSLSKPSLQQERLAKCSKKEDKRSGSDSRSHKKSSHSRAQTDNTVIDVCASSEESIMEVQTDKMSHKEDNSKALMVSSKPHENIIEVQGDCGVSTQQGGSVVMTDRKMLGGEVPTNSDKLHKEAINKPSRISQKDSISEVSQQSDSSENKNISETETSPIDTDLPPKKHIDEMLAASREVSEDFPSDDQQHKESVSERLSNGDVLYNKHVNEEVADVDSMHKEDAAKDKSILAKRSINASDDSNITLKTILPNLESQVRIVDTLLKSKNSTNNMTPTELETQIENAKRTTESVEALQDVVTTNQDDVTSSENSDLSTNMHDEENNTLSSYHENLQNAILKDRNKNCSIGTAKNFVEIETLERPIDAIENSQVASSTLQTDVEERSMTPTDLQTQAENTKPTVERVEGLQKLITTNQEDVTLPENSDLPTDMHVEENNTLSSYHENLQNAAVKDRNKKCSIGSTKSFAEIEPLERPINATENGQVVSSTLQTDVEERSMTPTELQTQAENAKPTVECVEALQNLVTSNQEDVTSPENSDLSTNMHAEENNTSCSYHENLQNAALKDRNKKCSGATKNFAEVEPLERPIDVIENGQVVSSTLQTDVEERNMTPTELQTQADNVKRTKESVEAVQGLVTTNQEEVTSAENSDLSTNMHAEENNALCSYHENLQNAALKDRNKKCSGATKNFAEVEPLEKPIDVIENGQVVSSTLQTDVEERNMTPTELQTQAENAKPTTEGVEAVQGLVTTNQEEVISAENSDLPTNIHAEENNTLNSYHENLQNAAIKDASKNCSIGATKKFVEIEPLERPMDAIENGQIVSSTLQTDVEERNISSGISEDQCVSEERGEHCLLNNKDSNPSLQEVVSESLTVEKEHNESVNQSLPNPNESLSQTATFKKGNISFAIVNEPGCFRRRKFKRISSDNLNTTGALTVTKDTSDEHLHNKKLSGTKRPYEHLDVESSISPPVKKQAFADPHRDQLYPSAIEDKSVEGSSQGHFESNGTQADEKNTSVTETNTSNDKNNTSDLEEGEIEDSDIDEASEGNKKLNKGMQRPKVVKSVIHIESSVRKEQSGKYLEKGRKVRENRRKSHGPHLQEVARGNCDRQLLPKQLFGHCERRSPSELLIKDRNIKLGTKEKDQNSRSRSTSSETSRNTNEFTKNEKLKAVHSSRGNKVDTKSNYIREEIKDKKKVSSTSKSAVQNMPTNKPDLSAWTRLGNLGNKKGANTQSPRKENAAKLNGDNQDPFKIPANSNQSITPITKYIIKRRKVCNLQDNMSLPVVNISPPKPIPAAKNENIGESVKSVHLKTVAASNAGMKASQVNSISRRKTDFSTHSEDVSKAAASTSRCGASQTDMKYSRISADSKSVLRSRKTLSSQVSSDSSISTSSSSEYENNSDETWKPRGKRKRKRRKNPKTEVTKNRSKASNL